MLNNNFRVLIGFNGQANFKDVLGNNTARWYFVSGSGIFTQDSGTTYTGYNNNRNTYTYDISTAGNSYVDEQTTYNWGGLTVSDTDGGGKGTFNGFTLFVGSGTTEATANDFKLVTPLSLDVISGGAVANSDGSVTVIRTFKNNSGSSVTVKELGLYLFSMKGSYYANTRPVVMLGRKVLPAAITLADGDTYTFEYKINMSQITLG